MRWNRIDRVLLCCVCIMAAQIASQTWAVTCDTKCRETMKLAFSTPLANYQYQYKDCYWCQLQPGLCFSPPGNNQWCAQSSTDKRTQARAILSTPDLGCTLNPQATAEVTGGTPGTYVSLDRTPYTCPATPPGGP